ncbi:unnamed protein product [Dibothriocephalus latus]|uniref:DUF4200 domain-containing protein n=1 Tax=Dibothriocephalus latus TaxID=60516 RepID=A0A3P7N6I0_DIBLA|nr:unnamed protein product [Dibothriocephalus latus]
MAAIIKNENQKTDIQQLTNPFRIPKASDILPYHRKMNMEAAERRKEENKLPIHRKFPQSYRGDYRAKIIEEALKPESDTEITKNKLNENEKTTQAVLCEAASKVNREKESIRDFISKKREIFMLQYATQVKQQEMKRLKELSAKEEIQLEIAEKKLELDAALFDEFIKESDKNAISEVAK